MNTPARLLSTSGDQSPSAAVDDALSKRRHRRSVAIKVLLPLVVLALAGLFLASHLLAGSASQQACKSTPHPACMTPRVRQSP